MTQDEIIELAEHAGFVTNEIKSYVISPTKSKNILELNNDSN